MDVAQMGVNLPSMKIGHKRKRSSATPELLKA